MAIHRNRVIYQSEALFISPDATGYHFTGAETNVPGVGSGPFGLMTPPITDRQDFGGTLGEPALNSAGQLVGWQPGDAWPQWNPDNNMPAAKARFDGNADIDSHVETYTLIATVAGIAGNAISVVADGVQSLQQIGQNEGFAVNGGDASLVPDQGFTINGFNGGDEADGADPATRASVDISIPVESKPLPVEIVANFEGVAGNVTLTGDDTSTINQLVAGHNASNPDNTLSVIEGGQHVLNNTKTITLSGGSDGYAHAHGTVIKQLKRVQSANYGFTVNRADVNQFGHASRLDSIVVESPTVNLDFSYYILDGFNERMLEFVTNGATNTLSGLLTPELYQAGNNFFILTTPEARDAVRGDVNLNETESLENSKSVISLGNGYVTDYSVDISVGSIPTANVTVEGMNIKSDFGTTGNNLPSVDMRDGSAISNAWSGNQKGVSYEGGCTGLFSLPAANSGYTGCTGDVPDVAALRPGDVVLDLANAGLISKNVSGNANVPVVGSAHVQSVSIQLPLARTTLQRLGSTFGFSKSIDLPLNVSFNVNAMVADMKEGNMLDLLCDCDKLDVGVTVFDPECNVCDTKQGTVAMKYELKGARLESENFSSSIGDNKSVDLTFTAQIGGADDLANGLFISGKEANEDNQGLPPAWTGIGGQTTGAASGYLFGYRG